MKRARVGYAVLLLLLAAGASASPPSSSESAGVPALSWREAAEHVAHLVQHASGEADEALGPLPSSVLIGLARHPLLAPSVVSLHLDAGRLGAARSVIQAALAAPAGGGLPAVSVASTLHMHAAELAVLTGDYLEALAILEEVVAVLEPLRAGCMPAIRFTAALQRAARRRGGWGESAPGGGACEDHLAGARPRVLRKWARLFAPCAAAKQAALLWLRARGGVGEAPEEEEEEELTRLLLASQREEAWALGSGSVGGSSVPPVADGSVGSGGGGSSVGGASSEGSAGSAPPAGSPALPAAPTPPPCPASARGAALLQPLLTGLSAVCAPPAGGRRAPCGLLPLPWLLLRLAELCLRLGRLREAEARLALLADCLAPARAQRPAPAHSGGPAPRARQALPQRHTRLLRSRARALAEERARPWAAGGGGGLLERAALWADRVASSAVLSATGLGLRPTPPFGPSTPTVPPQPATRAAGSAMSCAAFSLYAACPSHRP